jgi:hypothetical protein
MQQNSYLESGSASDGQEILRLLYSHYISITFFVKGPLLHSILSQLNPVRPLDPYLPKVHLNVILPPTTRSYQWSLAFGPPNQNLLNTSPLPMHATCPAYLNLLDLITLTIFGEECRL